MLHTLIANKHRSGEYIMARLGTLASLIDRFDHGHPCHISRLLADKWRPLETDIYSGSVLLQTIDCYVFLMDLFHELYNDALYLDTKGWHPGMPLLSDITKFLIEKGADVNARSSLDISCIIALLLHLRCHVKVFSPGELVDVMRTLTLLLEAGADPNELDEHGFSSFDYVGPPSSAFHEHWVMVLRLQGYSIGYLSIPILGKALHVALKGGSTILPVSGLSVATWVEMKLERRAAHHLRNLSKIKEKNKAKEEEPGIDEDQVGVEENGSDHYGIGSESEKDEASSVEHLRRSWETSPLFFEHVLWDTRARQRPEFSTLAFLLRWRRRLRHEKLGMHSRGSRVGGRKEKGSMGGRSRGREKDRGERSQRERDQGK